MKLRIVNESGRAAYAKARSAAFAARCREDGLSGERISSVQFVRIPLGGLEPDEFLQLADAEKVAIEVDHPELGARALIARPLASALARDSERLCDFSATSTPLLHLVSRLSLRRNWRGYTVPGGFTPRRCQRRMRR